jgi:cytochrome bd-type quinol oxidase subunit 2
MKTKLGTMKPSSASARNSARELPGGPETRASGPGRLIIAVYGIFALSATARAAYQIATKFTEAPVAYLLSAFAAAVYVLAAVALARKGTRWYWISVVAIGVELLGVLAVGLLSLLDPALLPDDTVWSGFGKGYGYVPLLLPLLGLWWLWRHRPGRHEVQ